MSPIDTFRRAMRRHEKRARKMGLRHAVGVMRRVRLYDLPTFERVLSRNAAWAIDGTLGLPPAEDRERATYAFLLRIAADALTKLGASGV